MSSRFQFGTDVEVALANPARRLFLVNASGAASALVIGVGLPDAAFAQERGVVEQPPRPGAFVRIADDNTVTVIIKHLDMGQGTATGLTTVVAEELDADWAQMRYEFSAADTAKYRNTLLGVQGTGASTSMANSWSELRKAGAAARAMLVTAAATEWAVAEDSITCDKGVLRHTASGRQLKFGDVAVRAAALPVPANVALKDPKAFALIGTERARRLDSRAKTDGTQQFGLDVRLPGMLFAAMARPSHFGARLESVDDVPARAVPGVVNVVRTAYGVAVIAEDTWSAFRGRDALKPVWNLGDAETRSSDAMVKDFRALAQTQGVVSKDTGDVDEALRGAAKAVEAEYHFPYLAHAPLEPLNAVIEPTAEGVNVHAGCQFHTVDQGSIAQELGLRPDQVRIITKMAGGTFGRRANPSADYMKEAAAIFKASGGQAPIQLVWSRADDLHGGYYRSMFLHKVKAGVDAKGELVAWKHRVVGHSIGEGTAFARFLVKNGIDQTSQEGSYENKYAVKNFHCDVHAAPKKVPVLWWRSVGHSHSAFVVETMVDEMAVAAKKDPVAFRLARLGDNPRLANVLKLAAEKAQWGKALPAGVGRGVAAHESFGTFVAHVAQVQVLGGRLRVERVVCAVDCGTAVNPDVIRAQVEGGVAFALSAVLHQGITFKDGVVEQDNFHTYPLLRMHEMPKVEVHIVQSSAPPSGIGEPPVPTVGPAVANAYFAATRKRIRTLPFSRAGVTV